MPSWEIKLYNGAGQPVNTQVTNNLGKANFNLLRADQYTICETLQSGWFNTQPGVIDPVYHQPCFIVTLGSGQTATTRR